VWGNTATRKNIFGPGELQQGPGVERSANFYGNLGLRRRALAARSTQPQTNNPISLAYWRADSSNYSLSARLSSLNY
jgi:hypothetical protein